MYEAAGILVATSNSSPEVCLSLCLFLCLSVCHLVCRSVCIHYTVMYITIAKMSTDESVDQTSSGQTSLLLP